MPRMLLLLIPLLPAVWVDLTARRIPNATVLVSLLIAFVAAVSGFHVPPGPVAGAIGWGMGLLVGLATFMPLYLLRVMGAGDVKLMAAVGACLGPELAWQAALLALVLGGALAVLWKAWFHLPARALWGSATPGFTRLRSRLAPKPLCLSAARLPFSVPILMAGALVVLQSL